VDNVSFKYFLSLEIQLYYQKNTIWLGEFMPPVITVSSSEEGWLRKYTTDRGRMNQLDKDCAAKYGCNRPCCTEEPQVFECLSLPHDTNKIRCRSQHIIRLLEDSVRCYIHLQWISTNAKPTIIYAWGIWFLRALNSWTKNDDNLLFNCS